MNVLKLVLVLAVAAGAYNYWKHHGREGSPPPSDASSGPSGGFVSLPAVRGQTSAAVLVIAAEDCPQEDAQRADQLASELSRSGLPVVRAHSVGFDIPNGTRADLDLINRVMSGPLPVVFVRGRAKANPTVAEVLAEFRASAR